jgi:NADH:ubiquinone oxidoreductase subunit K
MYTYLFFKTFSTFANFLLDNFVIFPLVLLIIFFLITTFYLYYSLKNIFKIFFLTETLLLISVIFLVQIAAIYPNTLALNFFYCQIILAAAAAEGALFLGLFSYLYDQQYTNRVNKTKNNTLYRNPFSERILNN